MTSALTHRGPDASGIWTDSEAGIGLGHRRLSIIDLSPAGAQPMHSADGRWVIAYNGEIYNANDIKAELSPPEGGYRGHSDTEILLQACTVWGVEAAIRRMDGMFAAAVWDRQERCLYLIRDRIGKKPLYWTAVNGLVLFASELKALRAHEGWTATVNKPGLTAFLRLGYLPGSASIYDNVHKLPPGTILRIGPDGVIGTPRPFWSVAETIGHSLASPLALSDLEAADALEGLLEDAVRRRMVSDVPLGAFLSGGIDSSIIVALMQRVSSRPVRSYSIGFEEGAYDESLDAARIARHLGTEHTELRATPQQALDLVPSLADIWDEPFADSSQIPTVLVCALARRHVTVALSGDGGDEVFAGYNRYLWIAHIWSRLEHIPLPLRRWAAGVLAGIPVTVWDTILSPLPGRIRPRLVGDKLHKMANVMPMTNRAELCRALASLWTSPPVRSFNEAPVQWHHADHPGVSSVGGLQWVDTEVYLPDDILVKVDRASMSVAVEARAPLLDPRLLEFAWRLPMNQKIRGGQGKWLLRQVLKRYVPPELTDRPKMGFRIPLTQWLQGPLREWAEDFLSQKTLEQHGLLEPAPIIAAWKEFLSGRGNHADRLWAVLMFQAWYRRWMDKRI